MKENYENLLIIKTSTKILSIRLRIYEKKD